MNRKERRAAEKRGEETARKPAALAASAGLSIADLFVEANRLRGMGRLDEAQNVCRQILAREAAHVPTLNLQGLMAQASGDHRGALKSFAKAIDANEASAVCHYNAGSSHQALGHRGKAAAHFSRALALGMEEKAVPFILQGPVFGYIRRIAEKWPLPVTSAELFGTEGLSPLAKDIFLCAAMEVAILPNPKIENVLTHARAELLRLATGQVADKDVSDDIVAFACALARQCFVNEYVYAQSEAEGELAGALRDRLQRDLASGEPIAPLTLAVVAAYFPLHAIPTAEGLLRPDWPAPVAELLRVQLREPLEEIQERSTILKLVPIENSVSLEVMRQYEENPYPRWTIDPLNAFTVDQARGRTITLAEREAEQDILIAGCGTGLHAIQTALVYPNARVLALDISLTSLAHARRKTREFGLRNIEYAQADILELGATGRTFDSIESVGVLHHLAEPEAGWRVLVSLLRPGGKMRIGLYSDLARGVITEARARIAARGYGATVGDIRKCRQEMIREPDRWRALMCSNDFYSISGCRDLLFNVMEHCFTLPRISAFLAENDLSFLGFDPFEDPTVLGKFHAQFSDAADELSLDQWHRFETDHPDTFRGMYVFTVGKNARTH